MLRIAGIQWNASSGPHRGYFIWGPDGDICRAGAWCILVLGTHILEPTLPPVTGLIHPGRVALDDPLYTPHR
jgi:hypothetical protein